MLGNAITLSLLQHCNGFDQGIAKQQLGKHVTHVPCNNRGSCVYYVVRAEAI
jgi:hypothetical protein